MPLAQHIATPQAHDLSALLGASWAITEQGRQQVLATVMQALQGRDAMAMPRTRTACIRDGVAIIPVHGVLLATCSWWGGCDYESILRDFNAALDSNEVRYIVLDVDSPGGLTKGADELSKAIYAARGKKPIVAYVGGTCASAAYWVSSSADRIVAAPTALVGSIGCIVSLVDMSELLKSHGIIEHNITSDQSPLKSVDPSKPEDRDRVRSMVTQLASVFIGSVARNRSVGADTVEAKYGKGDVLVAAKALEAGMVDQLGDFESLMAELTAQAVNDTVKTMTAPSAVAGPRASIAPKAALTVKTAKPRAVLNVRAERKGKMAAPDLDKLKEYATALHTAIHSESKGGAAAEAAAPHMKSLHEEMGDKSPFYEDDDDAEADAEAKAIVRELGGVKAARGVLAAMGKTNERVADLEKQVAAARATSAAAELKAMLDEATVEGRIAPADRAEMEKLHAEHGMPALRACLSRLPKKPSAAREPAAVAAPAGSKDAPAAPVRLSPDELGVCKALGIKPEDYATHKQPYAKYLGLSSSKEQE